MGQYNNSRAKAGKQLEVLAVPNRVIADASAAQQKVGKGNLCRIKGAADEFVMFQDEGDTTAPDATTKETLETEAGYFVVAATKDYIRTSAAMRIEVIGD